MMEAMARTMQQPTRPSERAFATATIVFTGKLASMSRADAAAIVKRAQGKVVTQISKRTTMLVVGMEGWPLLADGTISNKLKEAEDLNRRGASIRIVSEEQFLELAGLGRGDEPQLRKSYSLNDVCDLLKLDPGKLRHWELLGLIRGHEGLYDFQDLVSLRTIAALVSNGVPASTISSAISRLSSILPGTDRPLAQLKIVAHGPKTLLAEIGDALIDPTGQMRLNFDEDDDADDEGDQLAPQPLKLPEQAKTAEQWFEQAHDHEVDGRRSEAADGYRGALAAQSHFPEAHFNLANVLVQLGQREGAIEHYRMASSQEPSFELAWYNLGYLLDEAGRTSEAVDSLTHAVEVDPMYADAHFNLASCLERLGRVEDAVHHWKMYLRLEPVGQAAAQVRNRLAQLRV